MKGKGVIMEIRTNSMVIMTNDCGFEEIKKRNDSMVGMEIEFFPIEIIKRKKPYVKVLSAIAAAIILLVVSSIYFMGDMNNLSTPVALLTIDINPSIVLEINHKHEVINIIPLNEEAKDFSLDSFKKQDATKVIDEIIIMAEEKGYLVETDENYVLLTTIFLEKNIDESLKNLPEELKKSTEESSAQRKGKPMKLVILNSNYETYLKAQEENTSVGKMEIYQRLEATDEGIILEDIISKKVKELLQKADQKEHPVFDLHPSSKEEKQHPVFDVHPSQKEEKQHPVFETHPGTKGENKKENKEDEKPSVSTIPSRVNEKKHPVFEKFPGLGKQKIKPLEKNNLKETKEKNNPNQKKNN